jgi:hypothetical protein
VGELTVPSPGMWALTEERVVEHYCLGDDSGGPLSREEVVLFAREIGNRRERWREHCLSHLCDLVRAYPCGIPYR